MLIFENVLFVVLFQNVAKSVGRALGFFIEKRWARSSLTVSGLIYFLDFIEETPPPERASGPPPPVAI